MVLSLGFKDKELKQYEPNIFIYLLKIFFCLCKIIFVILHKIKVYDKQK